MKSRVFDVSNTYHLLNAEDAKEKYSILAKSGKKIHQTAPYKSINSLAEQLKIIVLSKLTYIVYVI